MGAKVYRPLLDWSIQLLGFGGGDSRILGWNRRIRDHFREFLRLGGGSALVHFVSECDIRLGICTFADRCI